eukprot:g6346.t1
MSIERIVPVASVLDEIRADDAARLKALGGGPPPPFDITAAREGFARVRRALGLNRRLFRQKFRAVLRFAARANRPGAGFWFLRHCADVNAEVGVRGVSHHHRRLVRARAFVAQWAAIGPGFVGNEPASRRGIDPEPRRADVLRRRKARALRNYAVASLCVRRVALPFMQRQRQYAAMAGFWARVLDASRRVREMDVCMNRRHARPPHCPACGAISVRNGGLMMSTDVLSVDVLKLDQRAYADVAYEECLPLRVAKRRLRRLAEHVGALHEDRLAALVQTHAEVRDATARLLQALWALRQARVAIAEEKQLLLDSQLRVYAHIAARSAVTDDREYRLQLRAATDIQRVFRACYARDACAAMARVRAARRVEENKLALTLRSIRGDRKLLRVVALRKQRAEEEARRQAESDAAHEDAPTRDLRRAIQRPARRRESQLVPAATARRAMEAAGEYAPTIFRYEPMVKERRIGLAQAAARTYVTRYW